MEYILSECDKFNKINSGIVLEVKVKGEGNNTLILSLKGYLDNENSSKLSDFFLHIIKESGLFYKVIFDLKRLNYVSSTGISALVTILKETKLADIELILCNVNSNVRVILDMLGLISFFNIVPALEDVHID